MHMEKLAERIEKDLKQLEQYTATPGKGCTRLPFTKETRMAVEFLKERMLEAGFTVHEDEAGNVIGVLAGEETELPCVMMGSHYDSVINGGNYDGIAGVVTAIEVARQLKERGIRRKRNFVVVGFCDEEGIRFGTGFFGSGALFGKYDVDYCKKFCDSDGISIYDAMKEYGLDAEKLVKAAWKKGSIGYFIESHIEQGPVLEREGIELGLVDGIVGLQRYMVTVHGRADHAGTTPMEMRSDAMEVASGVIAKIPQWAREMQDGTVATVGYINSCPGGINIVAEKVNFSVDVRSMNNEHIECIVEKMKQELQKIADSHEATFDIEEKLRIEPLYLSEKLLALMENSCKEHKFTYRRMCSGAGHDTLEIGQNGIPSVMVFVPSKDGRSHCPVEWSSYEDLAKAAAVVTDLVEELVNE